MQKIAKLTAATAVVVITLVLAVGSVTGSNMGFKLEKSFEVIPGNGNIYLTSFPFFASFPDTNDSPAYVPVPNGMVDSEDALRDMWEGVGSMEITATRPARSVGKLRPSGALFKKSSPGKGGPLSGPLKRADWSTPATAVNRPVVTGVPSMTTQPS